ncbi:MAG: hypothetical protein FJY18_02740, partial [Bacteroidetes bacterium]|nr:hypothetical protein [Bacteroidota bacterium]
MTLSGRSQSPTLSTRNQSPTLSGRSQSPTLSGRSQYPTLSGRSQYPTLSKANQPKQRWLVSWFNVLVVLCLMVLGGCRQDEGPLGLNLLPAVDGVNVFLSDTFPISMQT